jgi:hypothetical protein
MKSSCILFTELTILTNLCVHILILFLDKFYPHIALRIEALIYRVYPFANLSNGSF